ncbi:hypothetical protein ACH4YO_38385 [Streptomyces noursei]
MPTGDENARAVQATGARSVSVADHAGFIATGDGATNIRHW